jgi:hypothetical protein
MYNEYMTIDQNRMVEIGIMVGSDVALLKAGEFANDERRG